MGSSTDQDIRHRLLLARLPAMPQILLKLMALCQSDSAGMAELAELVGADAAMSAKVLGIANSAAFQRGQPGADLQQALNVLGTDMLKTLVISESVHQTIHAFPHARGVDLRPFWQHALTSAVLARELARRLDHPQPEQAYLGGLLHDVGRLALLAAAPNEYSVHFAAADDDALSALEQRLFQLTHAEAGAWLVERWKLDSFLADAVLYHHEPTARVAGAVTLVHCVHLAHRLAALDEDAPLPQDDLADARLEAAELAQLRAAARRRVAEEAALLGIDLAATPAPAAPPAAAADPLQRQLEDELRQVALTAEVGLALGRQPSEAQMLDLVRRSARVLLQLDDSLVLRPDDSGTALVAGAAGPARQRLQDFALPLQGDGPLAEAVRSRRIALLQPGQTPLGLAEAQLLRLFEGAEMLLGLPLSAGGVCQGLLVSGVPRWRLAELQGRQRLLQAFAGEVGRALRNGVRVRDEQERRLASLRESHELQARKVAHEVNNPLGIMKNYLGVLDDKIARQQPVTQELAILNEELDRVSQLTQQFAGHAARTKPPQGADVNRIVHQLAELFRGSRFLPAGVQLEVRTQEGPARVRGSADALKQVLINLVKNAVEALPRGGLIEIVNQGPVHQDGRLYFHLLVRDDGPGLPASVLDRLFAPVDSAKPGHGRGLGLSIVHDLVRQMGGSIRCASTPAGTTFDILLPQED